MSMRVLFGLITGVIAECLLAHYPHQRSHQNTDDDPRRKRQIKSKVFSLDDDITGKSTKSDFA